MTEEARFCAYCGAPLVAGAAFCQQCGRPVAGQPAQEPPTTGATGVAPVAPVADYPVKFDVDYPERLGRLSTVFRIVLFIPVLIILYLLAQSLIWVYWIAILVRGRPVRWLFDANVATQRFSLRSYAYFLLLTDRYPPFEGDWPVRYEVDYPERLSRRQLVIWKMVMVIPHFIVLGFVSIAVAVVVPIAWFAVLFTGRYPRGLHTFVSGWLRWAARASAYGVSFTDEFPSFSFSADAGRGSTSSYVISAIFGWLIVLAWVGGIGALVALPGETEEATISYERLLAGEPSVAVEVSDVEVMLLVAEDPYGFTDGLYGAEEGRFVLFFLGMTNARGFEFSVREGDFRLKDSEGDRHDPFLVTLGGLRPPRDLEPGDQGLVGVLFEVPVDVDPAELVYRPSFGFKQKVKFILE